jgi:uncharacterized delta-60 repeat protein
MRLSGTMSRRLVVMATAVISLLPATSAAASHPGALDRSFNGTGRATATFKGESAYAYAVGHQGASIIVVGTHELSTTADVAVARFTPTGKLDRTFGGGDGRVTIDVADTYDDGEAVAVLPDGKILIAGYSTKGMVDRFLAIRLTSAGRIDRSFGGGDGIVVTGFPGGEGSGLALTVLSDGRFEICGTVNLSSTDHAAVVRYLPGGRVDGTFGTGGRAVLTFPTTTSSACSAITHQGNKTVIVGTAATATGFPFAVARLGPGGLPDPGFDGDGYGLYAESTSGVEARGVVPLPNGKVVIAGTYGQASGDVGILIQLTPTGAPDNTFAAGGAAAVNLGASPYVGGLVRQDDGRLIVVGRGGSHMWVVRYRPRGTRDTTFGHAGIKKAPWGSPSAGTAVTLVGNTIVVAGYVIPGRHRFAVERLFA